MTKTTSTTYRNISGGMAYHYYTVKQTAEKLKMTPQGVRKMIYRGKLIATRLGNLLIVRSDDLIGITRDPAGRGRPAKVEVHDAPERE